MVTEAGRSILVVEDEEALADSIQYNLEREGYEVEVVGDGRSALQRYRAGRHDLVLLDLMLPEMSGLDVCRTLRAESTVPIIGIPDTFVSFELSSGVVTYSSKMVTLSWFAR